MRNVFAISAVVAGVLFAAGNSTGAQLADGDTGGKRPVLTLADGDTGGKRPVFNLVDGDTGGKRPVLA